MVEEIAFFPLPGAVSLPFSVKPLHIFEPRYLAMMRDCTSHKRKVGLAHTKQSIKMKSQHDHYEAYDIFSAGEVQILETLSDGRMIVQIQMQKRYRVLEVIQEVPYKVVMAEVLLDQPIEGDDESKIQSIRSQLDQTFIDLMKDKNPEFEKYIHSQEWKSLSHEEYSYAIYSLVLIEPDSLQKVLEFNSIFERVSFLLSILYKKYLQ